MSIDLRNQVRDLRTQLEEVEELLAKLQDRQPPDNWAAEVGAVAKRVAELAERHEALDDALSTLVVEHRAKEQAMHDTGRRLDRVEARLDTDVRALAQRVNALGQAETAPKKRQAGAQPAGR